MITTMYIDGLQIHGGAADTYGVSQFAIGSPSPRAVTENRPVAHGASDATFFYGPRTVELVGRVLAPTTAELWTLVDDLKGALRLGAWRVLLFRRQGLDYDERMIVRVDSPVDIPLALGSTRMVPFGVTLFAPDPRIYSGVASGGAYDPTTMGGASLSFPLTFPLDFSGDGSATLDVVNEGNTDTPAIYRITGPVVNPVVTDETIGLSIYTTGLDLGAGETITLDTGARAATLQPSLPAFPDTAAVIDDFNRADQGPEMSPNWFPVNPGVLPSFRVRSNQAEADTSGLLGGQYPHARLQGLSFGPDFDIYVQLTDLGGQSESQLEARSTTNTDHVAGIYKGYNTDGWELYVGTDKTIATVAAPTTINDGDWIGVRRAGNRYQGWYKPAAGAWTLLCEAYSNSVPPVPLDAVGVYMAGDSAPPARFDNLSGGTIVVPGATLRPDLIDSSRTTWFELAPGTNRLRMTGTGMSSGSTELAVEYRSARI